MSQLKVSRVIADVNENGESFDFVIPDMPKLMSSQQHIGDEILIPVNVRDDQIRMWEFGGRNTKFVSSIGSVIASNNDKLLNAMLFNKLNKKANGKQALVIIKPGYFLYIGKISIRKNVLAPKIKVLKLEFVEIDHNTSSDDTKYGKFVVNQIFTNYDSLSNSVPGMRLVAKLFKKNAIKPYFANGWTTTNINNIDNKDQLREVYERLLVDTSKANNFNDPDQFLDTIEDTIVDMNNTKLSAAFQWIDFDKSIVGIAPISDISLSDIDGTIGNAKIDKIFTISISNLLKSYNPHILFEATAEDMLKMAMMYDDKYSINIKDQTFGLLRGFRG